MTNSRIKISDLANGGKEFVAPAMRNFKEKKDFTILLLFAAVALGTVIFVIGKFLSIFIGVFTGILLPSAWAHSLASWARFLAVNFFFSPIALIALILVLLGIVCVDIWLRSTKVIAVPGELRIVTHWLFVRKTNVIPASKILEITATNNTTADGVYYYDIVVSATNVGKNRLVKLFGAFLQAQNPNNSISEEKMKEIDFINSGGKKIHAITNIIGQTEADAILQEINNALGRK